MLVRAVFACSLLTVLTLARPASAQEPTPAASPTPPAAPASSEVGAAPAPQASPGEPAPPGGAEEPVRLFDQFLRAWHAPGASADARLKELRGLRDQNGLAGIPGVARVMTVEGFRALDQDNRELAVEDFEAALELDPGASDARLGLAMVEGAGKGLAPRSFSDLWRAARLRVTHLRSSPFVAAHWLLVAIAGLAAAAIIAIATLMLRKQGLLRHDVEESLKRRFESETGRALAWAVVALPLLLTFDLYWAALCWAVFVWAYLDGEEQAVLVASLLSLALVLPAVAATSQLVDNATDPYVSAAISYVDGVVDGAALHALEDHVAGEPTDADAQLLLALAYERNGEPRRAIKKYHEMIGHEASAEAYNNLANVHYRLEEKDKAFEYWKKALEMDPASGLAHYNLSIYYFGFFEFDKKDEHFNKAKASDPKAVDRWVAQGSSVVDARPDQRQLQQRLWAPEQRGTAAGQRAPIQAALRAPQTLAALAALVLGFAYSRKRRGSGVATACVKCGEAFCPACKPGKEREDYCLQCIHLFIRKDGVSPQMRAEKIKEIGRNQFSRKAISSVLSLVAPGAGGVYRDQPFLGYLLLVLWCLSLAAYLLDGHGLLEPGFVTRARAAIPLWLCLVPAALVWLVANAANALRKEA